MSALWSFRVGEVRRRTPRRRAAFAVIALLDVAVAAVLWFQAGLWWCLAYVAVSTVIFARVVTALEAHDYAADSPDAPPKG